MQEHVFLDNEEILITSTRLVINNKTIAMNSICTIELDREDVRIPWIWLSFIAVGLLMVLLSIYIELGWTLTVIGAVFAILILTREKKDSIILEKSSGEKEVITKDKVDDLESVFKALNDVIIFRG